MQTHYKVSYEKERKKKTLKEPQVSGQVHLIRDLNTGYSVQCIYIKTDFFPSFSSVLNIIIVCCDDGQFQTFLSLHKNLGYWLTEPLKII